MLKALLVQWRYAIVVHRFHVLKWSVEMLKCFDFLCLSRGYSHWTRVCVPNWFGRWRKGAVALRTQRNAYSVQVLIRYWSKVRDGLCRWRVAATVQGWQCSSVNRMLQRILPQRRLVCIGAWRQAARNSQDEMANDVKAMRSWSLHRLSDCWSSWTKFSTLSSHAHAQQNVQ